MPEVGLRKSLMQVGLMNRGIVCLVACVCVGAKVLACKCTSVIVKEEKLIKEEEIF